MDCRRASPPGGPTRRRRPRKTGPLTRNFRWRSPYRKTQSWHQKKEIAELESKCKAKIAERELFVKGEIAKAVDKGDFEAIEQLEKQLASDRKSLHAEMEEKKEKVRQVKG